MKETVLHLFEMHPQAAIGISLLLSILVAVAGILPSFFITAANILFFGFWEGTLISFIGEAVGALIAFWLYRKGFKKAVVHRMHQYPQAQRLIEAENKPAFLLVLSLRLLPFVPSGLVTFAAAVGKINTMYFWAASSIGKIPALLIEAYSVYQITQFQWQGKVILLIAAIALVWVAVKKYF